MKRVAKRISETSKKSFGMYEMAAALSAQGRDLIHLELGKPHADTPTHIKEAAIDALRAGMVHYSDMQGSLRLRQALAAKLAAYNEVPADPANIVVTNGLTHASYAAFMSVLDPGDEVILLGPYYPQHVGKIELAGAKPVFAELDADDRFSIKAALIEPLITARTRLVVLVNPCNPTGRVYRRDELQVLADLALKHDLLVASDEVYEEILFDDAAHVSIASLEGMADRTISMFAFTKAYAMDGWRLGYVVTPDWLTPGLLKITANEVTHVNTFIQEGALAAVTGPRDSVRSMVDDDRTKRDMVVAYLNRMPGVRCEAPEGTIYAFPDISATGIRSQELAERILTEAGVVVESGSFYGPTGDKHIRICFGSESFERIEDGMKRMTTFFAGLAAAPSGA